MTAAVCQAIGPGHALPESSRMAMVLPDAELISTITIYKKGSTLNGPTNEVNQQEIDISVELTWKDLRTGEILSRPGRRPGEPRVRPGQAVPPLLPDPTLVGPNPPIDGARCTPGMPSIPSTPTLPGTPAMAALGTNPAPGTPGGIAAHQGNVPPVPVTATFTLVPELGSSTGAARANAYKQLAIQIVSLMEKPW